jgi:uncharacterized membrane protein YfcA
MLTLTGLVIGMAIGITGVGGGVLTAPILIALFGLPPAISVGTALLFSSVVKILSASLFTARKQVHGRTLMLLLYGGVPGALAGAFLTRRFATAHMEPWLLVLVGATVCLTGGLGLIRANGRAAERSDRSKWLPLFSLPIGMEVGFSSAGAGALGTVVLFNQTLLTPAQVVGTDLLFGLIVSSCAGGLHLAVGNWDSGVLMRLLLGGVPGALAGSLLATRLSGKPLRLVVLAWAVALGALLAVEGLSRVF